MLVKHIRNANKLIGTVVALDADVVGWAQCCPKDNFSKKMGVRVAEGRALKGTKKRMGEKTRKIMEQEIEKMRKRSRKYFQAHRSFSHGSLYY